MTKERIMTTNQFPKLALLLVIFGLALAACGRVGGAAADASATEVPIAVADTQIVAEGRLVPRESVELSFVASGQVTEVLVKEGDQVKAGDVLDKAKDDFEPYANKPEDNLVRAVFLNRLAEAQRAYDDTVRRLNRLDGVIGSDFDISQAQAEMEIAQARLEQAQKDFKTLQTGPDPEAVALAESRVKTSEGRIQSAEAALADWMRPSEDLDLVATIAGTVVNLDLILGEQVTPGTLVVQLADFSQWYVETDNLTEIDVVNASTDQAVSTVLDALPDVQLSGQVESIRDVYEEKRGDVTYTARILVNEG